MGLVPSLRSLRTAESKSKMDLVNWIFVLESNLLLMLLFLGFWYGSSEVVVGDGLLYRWLYV